MGNYFTFTRLEYYISEVSLIHDGGQVPPRARHLEVGDVAHPHLMGSVDGQGVHMVVGAGKEASQSRHAPVQRGRARLDGVFPHQALDTAASDRMAGAMQRGMHARAAVGLPAVPVHLAHVVEQHGIGLRAGAGRTIAPGIEPARAHPVEAAEPPHRVGFLLVCDEGEDVALRSEVNAIAFFKRSCSSLSCS